MYFTEPFQEDIPSPVEDAKATMRIFREIYVKIKKDGVAVKCNNIPFE